MDSVLTPGAVGPADGRHPREAKHPRQASRAAGISGRQAVLLVDDVPSNRKLLRGLLEGRGYAVVEAADGVEALAVMDQQPVDAIISDVLLPNMDGYQLCRAIRRHERWGALPFIFYSGTYREPDDAKLALEMGGDRFVDKSAGPSVIAAALADALANPRSGLDASRTLSQELALEEQYSRRLLAKIEDQGAQLRDRTQELERELAGRLRTELALQESERRFNDLLRNVELAAVMLDTRGRITYCNEYLLRLTGWRLDEVLGRPWMERFLPPSLADFDADYADELKTAKPCWHQLYPIMTRAGERRLIQWNVTVLRAASGEVAGTAKIGEDVTERMRAQQNLTETVRRLDEAQALAHIGSWERDLVNETCDWSHELFRIFRRDAALPAPTYAEFLACIHPDDRDRLANSYGEALEQGGTRREEYRTNPELGPVRNISTIYDVEIAATGQPVRARGTVLDITDRKQAEAEQHAAAERLQALSRRLVKVQEAEQRHIAGELHDGVAQNLSALCIDLDVVARLVPEPSAPLTQRLKGMRALAERTIASVRNLMSDLRPAMLDEFGLLAALRWLAEEHGTRTGMVTEVDGVEGDQRLPANTAINLFRIAQEALANAARHSRAGRVRITLHEGGGHVMLSVSDDGVGFDPRTPPGVVDSHWGLTLMRERAHAIGAELDVASVRGQGTRVVVDLRHPA